MSKKLLWVLAILVAVPYAWGQANFSMPPPGGVVVIGAQVVTTCATGSLATTTPGFVTIDTTGKLCTSGTSSVAGAVSISANGNTAVVKPGNTIAAGDNALAVGDATLLAAVQAPIPAGTNPIGYVALSPVAIGGLSPYHLSNVSGGTTASTNSTSIKSVPGLLYRLTCISTSATLGYLKIYDSATAPTCSSATGIKHVYPCPANTAGAGFSVGDSAMGEGYVNGIGFCVTGGGGDTDNTNAPTGIYIEGSYK